MAKKAAVARWVRVRISAVVYGYSMDNATRLWVHVYQREQRRIRCGEYMMVPLTPKPTAARGRKAAK